MDTRISQLETTCAKIKGPQINVSRYACAHVERPSNMADLASNQQSSSSKRPWYSDLNTELGTQHFADIQEHSYNDTQPKRSRQINDGGTNLADCDVVSDIFSGCCKTGSTHDADGKSARNIGLFDNHLQNGG